MRRLIVLAHSRDLLPFWSRGDMVLTLEEDLVNQIKTRTFDKIVLTAEANRLLQFRGNLPSGESLKDVLLRTLQHKGNEGNLQVIPEDHHAIRRIGGDIDSSKDVSSVTQEAEDFSDPFAPSGNAVSF